MIRNIFAFFTVWGSLEFAFESKGRGWKYDSTIRRMSQCSGTGKRGYNSNHLHTYLSIKARSDRLYNDFNQSTEQKQILWLSY